MVTMINGVTEKEASRRTALRALSFCDRLLETLTNRVNDEGGKYVTLAER